MTLGERQELFMRLLFQFLEWFYKQPGWELRMGEGFVGDTDAKDGDYDGPHKQGGGHYNKTAIDLNLFVNGQWVQNSSAPEWQIIGTKWRSLHPLARSGGSFGDANHLAVLLKVEGGKEYY